MGVDAALGLGSQHSIVGLKASSHAVHCQGAAGVRDIDTVRAVTLHQLGLLGQRFRRRSYGSSSGSRTHPCRACGRTRCAAWRCRLRCSEWRCAPSARRVRRRARDRAPCRCLATASVVRRACLMTCAAAAIQSQSVCGAEAVVERRAGKSVTVGDLDGIDPCRIQRTGNGSDMLEAVPMADGVHAVAQRYVLDIESLLSDRHNGAPARLLFPVAAARQYVSAVLSAAEVMISRLPA